MTYKIVIIGAAGSGKTYVTNLFDELGCDTWVSDTAMDQLVLKFPNLDALPKNARHSKLDQHRMAFFNEAKSGIAVMELPRSFWKKSRRFLDGSRIDMVICVTVDHIFRLDRLKKRKMQKGQNLTLELAEQENLYKMDMECQEQADHVIISDTPDNVRRQIQEILGKLQASSSRSKKS